MVPGSGDHAAIYANFLDAIQHGAQLVADGEEGRLSLELANALIYSSHTDQHVSLPLDRAAYGALLDELRANRHSAAPGFGFDRDRADRADAIDEQERFGLSRDRSCHPVLAAEEAWRVGCELPGRRT